MSNQDITIQSFIDARVFSKFAWFDLLRVQKRWRRPAAFAAFFAGIAALAFSRAGSVDHAALLGGVLLAVGLGLPAAYFFTFHQSVRRQSAGFTGREAAYTVTLDGQGVCVVKGKQRANCAWRDIHAVHRLDRCICIYVEARRAFLLPSADNSEAIRAAWELMAAHLTPGQLFDHRQKGSISK